MIYIYTSIHCLRLQDKIKLCACCGVAASRLLSRSANVYAESAFGETPLDVARDNVAEFCRSVKQ